MIESTLEQKIASIRKGTWIAMDEDGFWSAYSEKPEELEDEWWSEDGCFMFMFYKSNPIVHDWTETLEQL